MAYGFIGFIYIRWLTCTKSVSRCLELSWELRTNCELCALDYLRLVTKRNEALATSALIRRHDASTITNLVDDLAVGMHEASGQILVSAHEKQQRRRWAQVVTAALGTLLVVFGKVCAWRHDFSK